ncbi:MAG: DUF2252 domain-containing protein [Actinobacteria bacterium]|nr:DUF2252 domain-containing protein [Actinomycetota bacterium]
MSASEPGPVTYAFGTYSTPAERKARGKAARETLPRTAMGDYSPSAHRPDPIAMLEDQEQTRVPNLLPLRHERMGVSAFTFYRGTAIIMANDLGAQTSSGLQVQLCGDAHLSNFGLFAAPDRVPVFDVNDFDETNPGPFEWDVKRLATSFVLAARDNGFPEDVIADAALASARQYRLSMAEYAAMKEIDIWYDRVDASVMESWAQRTSGKVGEKAVRRTVAKAQARTAWTAIRKLTTVVDGQRVFVDEPPLVVRVPEDTLARTLILGALPGYLESLAPDRRALLERYEVIDLGHKVVGVGSVGLLAWVLLLQGRDSDDILTLQVKQAQHSVLEPYTAASAYPQMGERVVEGQRLMQAASDSFLGWVTGSLGREYYVRQLRDMKWSPDPSRFTPAGMATYAELCGHVLARAHARTGDAVAISAYLGSSTTFDDAVRAYALSYADQVSDDFAGFTAAVSSGRLSAEPVTTDSEQLKAIMRNPLLAHGNQDQGGQASPSNS